MMFSPFYLVTPSAAWPLPTDNYPNRTVRVGAVTAGSIQARNTRIAIRHNSRAQTCPVLSVRRRGDSAVVRYVQSDGVITRRRLRLTQVLFLDVNAIIALETLLMLTLLFQSAVRLLPAPPSVPRLPAPKPLPCLPAPRFLLTPVNKRTESTVERRIAQMDAELRARVQNRMSACQRPVYRPLLPAIGA